MKCFAILEEMQELTAQISAWREDFHAHPELAFQEKRTSGIIAEFLHSLGLEVKTGIAGTGIIAYLRVNPSYPMVALRADMDAIAATEKTDVPYRSQVDNVAHLCGHDGHSAALMGAAKVLVNHRDELKCNVKLIFQPAEEICKGSAAMIREGVMEDVDFIFGGHVTPSSQIGTFRVVPDAAYCSSDSFNIRVKGIPAHSDVPSAGIDPVQAACELVQSIYQLHTEVNPWVYKTLIVNTIRANETGNVTEDGVMYSTTAEEVLIGGGYTTLDRNARKFMERRIREKAEYVCKANRCEVDVEFIHVCPVLYNDVQQCKYVQQLMEATYGEGCVLNSPPSPIGDDMAMFLEEKPGVYFLTGINPGRDPIPLNHNADFYMPSEACVNQAAVLAMIAINFNQGE